MHLFFFATLLLLATAFSLTAQELKCYTPREIVKTFDFSAKAQLDWKTRNSLLASLDNGDKKESELTAEERKTLVKFDDRVTYLIAPENVWDSYTEGCSWYCAGGPDAIDASSSLIAQGSFSYEAKHAHDFNYLTAWVEGKPGYGIGESLVYTCSFKEPVKITEIKIANGYVKSEKAWKDNSRVKKLKVFFNEKPLGILVLTDVRALQTFSLPPLSYKGDKETWTLRFEILEVYPGDKFQDTAISELFFDGVGDH